MLSTIINAHRPRMTCGLVALILVMLCGGSARGEEGQTILLLSGVGELPKDAALQVQSLVKGMGDEAPLFGEALARAIARRFSGSPGPADVAAKDRARAEEGRRAFIEGNYEDAIKILEPTRRRLLAHVAAVASNQAHRESVHQTLLFLAHAYLRLKQPERAAERVSEAIRSFTDRDLSLAKYSPDLVRFYKRVRRELRKQSRGTLAVTTRPAGCMVFINERFAGVSPLRAPKLLPGEYRVYVQRGNERGRVHPVMVSDGEETLTVDFDFDRRLRTSPEVSLRFADAADRRARQLPYASKVGQALHAPLVVLVGFGRHDGRRMLEATVVAASTGRAVRSARVALEPANPSPAVYRQLGRFLLAGQRGPGVIVTAGGKPLPPATGSDGDGSGFFSARVFKWITAGLAAGAVAGGVTLIAIDGKGTCDPAPGGACADLYQTKGVGIGLTIGGGLLAATSIYLFIRDAGRPAPGKPRAWLAPVISPGRAGVVGALSF